MTLQITLICGKDFAGMSLLPRRDLALLSEDAGAARASEGRWPRICERVHVWTSLEVRRARVF